MDRTVLAASIVFAAVLVPASAFAVSVEDVPNPRSQNRWVTDLADIIGPAEEAELNQMITAAEAELSVEIAVVTVTSVDTATPKDFATELFNYWGIGKADVNNGLLVLMVTSERRLEMETGYGTESALTDGWLKSMQEAEMIPRFKRGEFGEGILTGVNISIDRMREQRDGLDSSQTYSPSLGSRARNVPWWLWGIFGLFGVGGTGAAWKRRRDRTCLECKKKMQMLPDSEDDVHLDSGQKAEERLGSVDWEYWYCDTCGESRLLENAKWFSGYSRCPSCQNKTMTVSQSTITPATYSSSGLARVTEDCQHCSHHDSWTKTLPQLQESTSSSSGGGYSGGGSSFGGGSSGGGGAGSSW